MRYGMVYDVKVYASVELYSKFLHVAMCLLAERLDPLK